MLKYLIIFIAYFTAIFSLIIIVAWVFEVPIILSFLPGFITIKFSTGLSFFLSSLILYFAYYSTQKRFPNLILIVVTFSILVIWLLMITILVSIIFKFSSGIENLFITDETLASKFYVPGQPSLGTIIAFLFITILGLNIFYAGHYKKKIFLFIGLAVTLIGFIALIGLVLNIPYLYYDWPALSNAISIPAALLFTLMGLAFTSLFWINHQNKT